jgi:hypothetical protein
MKLEMTDKEVKALQFLLTCAISAGLDRICDVSDEQERLKEIEKVQPYKSLYKKMLDSLIMEMKND